MSTASASTEKLEQPFQLVARRTSGGGNRKGGSRERTSHGKVPGQSEEQIRKKVLHSKPGQRHDREVRLRPQAPRFHPQEAEREERKTRAVIEKGSKEPKGKPPVKHDSGSEQETTKHLSMEERGPSTSNTSAAHASNGRLVYSREQLLDMRWGALTKRVPPEVLAISFETEEMKHTHPMASTANERSDKRYKSKPERKSFGSWNSDCKSSQGRNHREMQEEEEPEWMVFGPTDRTQVIELKGMEEHEKERKGQEKECKVLGTEVEEHKGEGKVLEEASDRELEHEEEQKELEHEKDCKAGVLAEVENMDSSEDKQLSPVCNYTGENNENEFVVDGFDFSTAVGICNVLDEEDASVVPSDATNQAKEPVKERSDIKLPDNDQTAFNKLVAELQSSGSLSLSQPPPSPIHFQQRTPQESFVAAMEGLPLAYPASHTQHGRLPVPGGGAQQHPKHPMPGPAITPADRRLYPTGASSQEKWVDNSWLYHRGEHHPRQAVHGSVPAGMPHHPHPHSPMRASQQSWYESMESRRLVELQQIQQATLQAPKFASPKHNISLLPTAVMRQLHSNKQASSVFGTPGSKHELTATQQPSHVFNGYGPYPPRDSPARHHHMHASPAHVQPPPFLSPTLMMEPVVGPSGYPGSKPSSYHM